MVNDKPAKGMMRSKTFWGNLIIVASLFAGLLHIPGVNDFFKSLTQTEFQALTELLAAGTLIVGGVLRWIGKKYATHYKE